MMETGRALVRTIGTVALLCCLMTPAQAEPGPVGNWLMNEPLTLWDFGMMNMERDAKQAAEHIKTSDSGWTAWAQYSWDNNEIEIRLIVFGFNGAISHATCNETRRSFLAALLGAYGMYSEKKAGELAHQAIGWWFHHKGFERKSRDEKLEEKLARIVFVAVRLYVPDGGITCRDRITTSDAPSKPH